MYNNVIASTMPNQLYIIHTKHRPSSIYSTLSNTNLLCRRLTIPSYKNLSQMPKTQLAAHHAACFLLSLSHSLDRSFCCQRHVLTARLRLLPLIPNSLSRETVGLAKTTVSYLHRSPSSLAALIEEGAQPSLQPFPTHYHPRVSLGT